MSKFDTHGGYFSPDNYIRINEGGTHEENPNGGVQIGVDPEGVPNMVEEDETVYDDYVFSDNITVDDAMVEKHNLPAWAKGKLYSKVTDRFIEEAEERPMDPISRSGLEEMLGRLRDAQEEQKQIQQERELEDELSQLSPEELDQLEAMLAQNEVVPVEEYPAAPEQMVGPTEPIEQMPVEAMPMMRNGGTLLRRFDGGGGLTDEQRQAIIDAGPILDGSGARIPSLLELALGPDNRIVQGVKNVQDWMENSTTGKVIDILTPDSATEAFSSPLTRQVGRAAGPIGRTISRGIKKIGKAILKTPGKLLEVKGRGEMFKEAGAVVKEAKEAASAARTTANTIAGELNEVKAALKADPTNASLLQQVADLEAKSAKADAAALKASARVTGATANAAVKSVGAATIGPLYNRAAFETEVNGLRKVYETAKAAADAAPTDNALKEAAETALKNLQKAEGNWNKWVKHGEWPLKGALWGGAAGSAGLRSGERKKENFVERQFKDGGKVNSFELGGEPDELLTGYERLSPYYEPRQWRYPYAIVPYTNEGIAEVERRAIEAEEAEAAALLEQANNRRVGMASNVAPFAYTIGYNRSINGRDFESQQYYQDFLKAMRDNPDSEFSKQWYDYIQSEIAKSGSKYQLKDFADWSRLAEDGKVGPVHQATLRAAQMWGSAPELPELLPVEIKDNEIGTAAIPSTYNGTLLGNLVGMINPAARMPAEMISGKATLSRALGVDSPSPEPAKTSSELKTSYPYLSTFPRYAGALTAGALGLYNAAMPTDEYAIPRINPVLPQGQLHLRDPRYNPLDEEQAVNTVLAANAGTNRQIMNSGLGPSIGATLLASDYNAGRNIGTARQTVWDANNQSRNAVNAAHNQNASALASFDYGQSRDRAQILNEAAYRNAYNDLTRQRLNYEAEGQKYAAIQSSLDSIAQALSGIGQENSILNALNSNTALYHWLSPNRIAAYKVDTNESKDGGFLRKKKTKIENEIEQQVRDLSEYGETLTKVERDERKKREAQQKIDNLWSPASPSELKRVFSGRKKKKN